MKKFCVFMLAFLLEIGWISGETCQPTMFNRTFDYQIKEIDVNDLHYDKSKSSEFSKLIVDVALKYSRYHYVCEDGFIDIPDSLKHLLTGEHRMSYLKITGIGSHYVPKMRCVPKEDKTVKPIYYLGKYEGTYRMSKQYSLADPHFYMQFKGGDIFGKKAKLEIMAIGKFYPCPDQALSVYNAYAVTYDNGISTAYISDHLLFHPFWGHQYLSTTRPLHESKFMSTMESKILLSQKKSMIIAVYDFHNITRSLVDDQRATFQLADHVYAPIYFQMDMNQMYHEASLVFHEDSWADLVKYGLPAKPAISQKFPIESWYLNAVQKMNKLTLKTFHTQTKQYATPTKYDIRAHGVFYDSPSLLNVALFRGRTFDFHMSGADLSEEIILQFMDKTCVPISDPRRQKLFNLWQMMWYNARRVLNPNTGYYDLDKKEVDTKLSTEPLDACPRNQYRIEYFKFNHLGGDYYHIELQYSTTNENGDFWLTTNWSNMALSTFLSELQSGAN